MRGTSGKNVATAEALRTLAQDEGLSLHVLELDVTDETSIAAAVEAALAQAGRIDVLINNAGCGLLGITEAANLEQIQALFNVNLYGTIRVTRAVLPTMRAQGAGLLLYISSTGSRLAYPFLGLYGATKAALEAFAEAMHYEVYSLGIDTAIVQLGAYATQFGENVALCADDSIWANYGAVGQIGRGWADGFATALTPAYASDPQQAAESIARLVEIPSEERPFRTALGLGSEGMEVINQTMAAVQAQVLPALGLDPLTRR
jgi:short-subunit dehydrogenase